jgi:hypothetical protein
VERALPTAVLIRISRRQTHEEFDGRQVPQANGLGDAVAMRATIAFHQCEAEKRCRLLFQSRGNVLELSVCTKLYDMSRSRQAVLWHMLRCVKATPWSICAALKLLSFGCLAKHSAIWKHEVKVALALLSFWCLETCCGVRAVWKHELKVALKLLSLWCLETCCGVWNPEIQQELRGNSHKG